MNDETTQSLKKRWDENAYPSVTPLYKLAQRRGLNVRIVDVKNWHKNRASTSLLQQRKEPYAVAGTFDNATEPLEKCAWICGIGVRTHHPMGTTIS